MRSIRPQTSPKARLARVLALGATALILAGGPASADYGYSYFRTVEGYATLESAEDGSSLEVLENHPLVAGDFLRVGSNSRVEVVLPDGSLLRIAERSEIRFDSLAWTPDTADSVTRLYLRAGQIQLVLDAELEREEPLELETPNATLYLEAPGEYRVTSQDYDRTEIVVREGFAEAQTDRGSAIVRSDEVAHIEGDEWPSVEIAAAGRRDRLESWGDELDEEAQLADAPYVDEDLRYRAARMADHGAWIDIGGRYGWRPHVGVGWRPYVAGTWVHTPSGLTWVSSASWGWIPSHYGSWDLVPGYGWVWFAGASYAPASVYWYWGPTHVAWIPSGYYTSFYSPRHHRVGPRFGIYGWAGGDWSFFAEWVFCPTRYFGRTHYNRYFRSGHEVARHATYREIPRGVIATDTRSVRRDVWGQPDRIMARLTAADTRLAKTRDLPDVTDFVARRRDIRPEVAEIVKPRELTTTRHHGRPVALEREVTKVRPRLETGRLGSASARFEEHKARVGGRTSVSQRSAEGRSSRPVIDPRAESKARVFERRSYGRPEIQRQSPGSDKVERPSSRERRTIRDSAGARERFAVPSREGERPVVQKVIERMRSRQAPAAPSPQTRPSRRSSPSSSSKAKAPSRPPRRDSSARAGESRASSSSNRSSSGKARSGSRQPPTRKSESGSRAARRKPPGID